MLESVRSQYVDGGRHDRLQHLTDLKVERPPHLTPRLMARIMAAADREADLKFSGGFNISKKNICEVCHEAKSVNGSCGC